MEALAAARNARSVFTRERDPREWARAQLNVGSAYVALGGRENINRALAEFQELIDEEIKRIAPREWALAQFNLGTIYLDLQAGDNNENVESAIEAFNAALQVQTRDRYPVEWAGTLVNLSRAYLERLQGVPAGNAEHARSNLEAALEIFMRERRSYKWALAQYYFGRAYQARAVGDIAENIEQALRALQAALVVFTRERYPREWATVQESLGDAYGERRLGPPEDSVERAIEAYEQALTVVTRERSPAGWARLTNMLATQYARRGGPYRARHLQGAIDLLATALSAITPDDDADEWVSIQINRSTLYANPEVGDPAENIERAIGALEAALTVRRFEEEFADPERRSADRRITYRARQWVLIQFNLGTIYAIRRQGERKDNLRKAIAAFEAALRVCSPSFGASVVLYAASTLGSLYAELEQWDQAYAAYAIALEGARLDFDFALTEKSKEASIEPSARIYAEMVDVCLRLAPARPLEAFIYAEEGRSRLLRAQLSTLVLPPPPGIPERLVTVEAELLERLRGLHHAIRGATLDDARRWKSVDDAAAVEQQLDGLWDSLARNHGAADYVALRRGDRPDWQTIRGWLARQGEGCVLLEFFSVGGRMIAFVARGNEEQPRAIPLDLGEQDLRGFAVRLSQQVHGIKLQAPEPETWLEISPLLLNDVMPHLAGADLIYLVPHGWLHYFPLHALRHEGQPLIHFFPIAYAPSAAIAARISLPRNLTPGASGAAGEDWLVVGNPAPSSLPPLRFAEEEALEVARRVGTEALVGPGAVKADIVAGLAAATHAHLAAHAMFIDDDPLSSFVSLAGDEKLTARELLAQRFSARLMVLSACQTGVQALRPGDELYGLSRALLSGGVPSLILSLWFVDDPVTMKLMIRFYSHLYAGEGPRPRRTTSTAQALRSAMLETYAEASHTYFWAPFVVQGEWR